LSNAAVTIWLAKETFLRCDEGKIDLRTGSRFIQNRFNKIDKGKNRQISFFDREPFRFVSRNIHQLLWEHVFSVDIAWAPNISTLGVEHVARQRQIHIQSDSVKRRQWRRHYRAIWEPGHGARTNDHSLQLSGSTAAQSVEEVWTALDEVLQAPRMRGDARQALADGSSGPVQALEAACHGLGVVVEQFLAVHREKGGERVEDLRAAAEAVEHA
jgi:hypothetical protein